MSSYIDMDVMVKASGTLTATGNFTANDTVIVGAKTYKFEASPAAENDVDLGGDLEESLANLAAAINGDFAVGQAHADTEGSPGVVATSTATTLVLTASVAGEQGNLIEFSEGVDGGAAFSVVGMAGGAGGDIGAYLQAIIDHAQANSLVIAYLSALV